MLSGLSSPTLLQQAVAPVTALLNTTLTPEEPSASTPTQTPTAPDDGVVFDLSDAALTTLQNAQTSPQGADGSAAPAASGSAPRSGATWAAAPAAQTQGTFAARLAEAEAEVDPDEEARARAAAVTAMERAAIQSIIENIKATRESKVVAAEAVAAVADTPRGPVAAPSDMPTRAAG